MCVVVFFFFVWLSDVSRKMSVKLDDVGGVFFFFDGSKLNARQITSVAVVGAAVAARANEPAVAVKRWCGAVYHGVGTRSRHQRGTTE